MHVKTGLAVVFMAGTSAQAAVPPYAWTASVAVGPPRTRPPAGRGDRPSLTGHGDRLWLSYLDAAYGRRSDSGS